MANRPTANFTIGPFFPPHFVEAGASDLTRLGGRDARGQRIRLVGQVFALDREARRNVIVEIWQPDAAGLFAHPNDPRAAAADPNFLGWGRAATDAEGWYRFRTIMPGRRADNLGGRRLPHINVTVLASGLMRRLVTTMFFADGVDEADDPVLGAVADPGLRRRLIARRAPEHDDGGEPAYRFDIVLRGAGETPFFLD